MQEVSPKSLIRNPNSNPHTLNLNPKPKPTSGMNDVWYGFDSVKSRV